MSFYISNAVAIERIIFVSLAILSFGLVSIGSLWLMRGRLSPESASGPLEGDTSASDFDVIAKEIAPALQKAAQSLDPSAYAKLTPEEKLLRAIFGRFEPHEAAQEPKTEEQSARSIRR